MNKTGKTKGLPGRRGWETPLPLGKDGRRRRGRRRKKKNTGGVTKKM